MQNQMIIKYLNPNEDMYGENAKFGLYLDEKLLATMQVEFPDAEIFTSKITVADDCYQLSPMHASSIIQHTIMSNWGENHDCFEDVFKGGALVVDPALYASAQITEQCNDSDTKQVTCKQCDTTYDGELPRWAEGDEECPECDHVQYEYKQ